MSRPEDPMQLRPAVRPRLEGRPRPGDLLGGVSVALVLLPQAVAYAVLAGVPPRAGLVAAAVATLAAAPFVASPLLQTGPTAITSLLTLGTITSVAAGGGDDVVGLAALLALLVGVVRLGIGASGAGEIAYLVSEPVLVAFTAAAGAVIVLSQVPELVGVNASGQGIALAAVGALTGVGSWNLVALFCGLAAVASLLLLERLHPLMPGVLVVVAAGVVVQGVLELDVATVGEIPRALPRVRLDLPWSATPQLAVPAVVIGLVGFSEASSIARTFARDAGQTWDADREFVSQGIANLAAGTVGGLPVGASFSRSSVNRVAGARGAWSGVLCGAIVLAALPFVGVLAELPEPVLAGVIVVAVLRLLDPRPVLELARYSRQQFMIAALTYVLTVAFAPQIQWAVLIGILLVVAAHLRRERTLHVDADRDGHVLHVQPIGLLHFGSVQRLEEQVRTLLDAHADADRLVVHLDQVGRTDVTGALTLRRLVSAALADGWDVQVVGITEPSRKILGRVFEARNELDGVLSEDASSVPPPWGAH